MNQHVASFKCAEKDLQPFFFDILYWTNAMQLFPLKGTDVTLFHFYFSSRRTSPFPKKNFNLYGRFTLPCETFSIAHLCAKCSSVECTRIQVIFEPAFRSWWGCKCQLQHKGLLVSVCVTFIQYNGNPSQVICAQINQMLRVCIYSCTSQSWWPDCL